MWYVKTGVGLVRASVLRASVSPALSLSTDCVRASVYPRHFVVLVRPLVPIAIEQRLLDTTYFTALFLYLAPDL
mgnify:CR=1 FL=1